VIYRVVAQAPRARNILFVATPISGLALELVRVLGERQETSDAHVTFVYADQQLVTAVSGYLPVEETQAIRERVRLVVEDPRAYLKTQSEAYDLIFVDAPEPTAAHVNRFYTAEFYAIARRALSASGVLCFRLPSSADYVGREISELTVSVHKALSSVFDHVVTTPGEESYFFASAAAGQLTDDPAVIAARLRAYDGAAPFRDEIALDYEPTRLKRIGELMTAGRDAIANSDDHPSSYYYGAVLWERFSSEQPSANSWLARAHVAVQSVRTMHAVGGVLGLVGLWLIVRKRLSRKALAIDAAVAALVAGLSSMALNLVLLMAYQCACGALYQRIAIMTALLMLGVALSSGAVGRLAPRLRKPSAAVAVVLVAVALFAFMLPSGLQWLSGRTPFTQQVSFGLLFACTGALLGAGYPLTAQVLLAHRVGNPNAARAGGLVDALDHFGAALGALTVGTIILPAVGATSTLRWVALVAFVVGGVWLSRTDD
jgi:spermidine synthase